MPHRRPIALLARTIAVAAAAALIAACGATFRPRAFPNSAALYQASLDQLARKNWENAILGLEKLAADLPARDSLVPLVHFQLGRAHGGRGEHLLAAQSFSRVPQEFPNDTLADDALFAAAREYQKMWRKPALDAEYGQTALATYRSVLNGYPDSPLVPQVGARIAELNDWFARKDMENAMHYVRRKAYDSAIIYLRDVTRMYPATPTAREAYMQLVRAYKAIRYREEMAEICGEMRRAYPTDAEVGAACGPAPATAAAPATPPVP